jgi:pyrroloquinoline quinone (PQQ) biosynthesis protein C
MFVRPAGSPYAVFQRALKNGNLWVAEAEARDLPKVSLEDALKLVYLYAEKESPKFDKAALRWLRRYLEERSPELSEVAKVVAELTQRREQPYSQK